MCRSHTSPSQSWSLYVYLLSVLGTRATLEVRHNFFAIQFQRISQEKHTAPKDTANLRIPKNPHLTILHYIDYRSWCIFFFSPEETSEWATVKSIHFIVLLLNGFPLHSQLSVLFSRVAQGLKVQKIRKQVLVIWWYSLCRSMCSFWSVPDDLSVKRGEK